MHKHASDTQNVYLILLLCILLILKLVPDEIDQLHQTVFNRHLIESNRLV